MSSPAVADRAAVQRMVAEGAQLIEVLPAEEYEDEHLPGAINLPLKQVGPSQLERLDPSVPTVVYCWDGL